MSVFEVASDLVSNHEWANWLLTVFSACLALVFNKLHAYHVLFEEKHTKIMEEVEKIKMDVIRVNTRIDLLLLKIDSNLELTNANIEKIMTILQYIKEGK